LARNKTPQNATQNGQATLSAAQVKALAVLGAGQSVSDAARAAEVDRTTVHRWLHNNPRFAAEFNAAQLEMADTVKAGLRQLANETISTLRDLMGPSAPASVRLRVVELVLSRTLSGTGPEQVGSPVPEQVEEAFKRRDYKDPLDLMNLYSK
jgi:hypothetical protein